MKLAKKILLNEAAFTTCLAAIIFFANIREIAILNGPCIFNDELGYLGNAAALAGKDWHEIMQTSLWYSYGWSLVIAPLFVLFSNMQVIYRCINVLNAILVVFVFLLQRNLLKKIFSNIDQHIITAVSACVCFYPAVMINSSKAWSETGLLFIFTLITVILYEFIRKPHPWKAFLFGVLLYYLYVCHNRMMAVLFAGVIIVILLGITRTVDKKNVILFVAALLFSMLLFGVLKDYVISLNWKQGLPAGNDLSTGISNLFNLLNVKALKNFVCVLGGQILYICVSSYGMLPLGLTACMCKLVEAIKKRNIRDACLEIWLILAFAGLLALSAIMMGANEDISSRRVDHIFYGRYFEPVCLLLIAYGFLYLTKSYQVKVKKIYRTSYACVVALCSLLSFIAYCQLNNHWFNVCSASGLTIYVKNFHIGFMFVSALCSLLITYILSLLFNKKFIFKLYGLLIFSIISVWTMNTDEKRYFLKMQKNYRDEIKFIKNIKLHETSNFPIYFIDTDSYEDKAFYQCMLVNIPLKLANKKLFDAIPEKEFYAIISVSDYNKLNHSFYINIIIENNNFMFVFVKKQSDYCHINTKNTIQCINYSPFISIA